MTVSSTIEFVDPCENPFTFTSTTQTNPPADKYTGNAIIYNLTPFAITPGYCEISYACDSITRSDGSTSRITCSDLTAGVLFGGSGTGGSLTYSIDSTQYQSGNYPPGPYTVTIRGTAINSNPSNSRTTTFTFILVDPCSPPHSVTESPLTNKEYTITDTQQTFRHPDWTISPNYCPLSYTYNIADITNVPGVKAISVDNDKTFTIYYATNLLPLGQSETVTITATSKSIYNASPSTKKASSSFVLTFKNPCIDPVLVTLAENPQTSPSSDKYTGSNVVFTYSPFTVVPSFCPMTTACKSVSGPSTVLTCKELKNGALTQTFSSQQYATGGLAPGAYIFTYEVTTDTASPSNAALTKLFTFTVTLVDPCDPPTSIIKAPLTNQVYTITDTKKTYKHPDWTISPNYCPLSYTYDIADITNVLGAKAISVESEKIFSIYYDQDLLPLG